MKNSPLVLLLAYTALAPVATTAAPANSTETAAAPDPIASVICLDLAEPVARTTFGNSSAPVKTSSDKGLPPAP